MFGKTTLQPGFRFHPTDVELVLYYLKRKIMGKPLQFNAISELDLYKFPPWDLPGKSLLQSNDLEWYFYCPQDKKYSIGSRTNRSTDIGFWKSTGRERAIVHKSRTVGTKKTLIFHVGRISRGERSQRTNWVMYEYRLEGNELANTGFLLDAYVLCKVFEKSGPGPKNGEQYGAPFKEEDWENNEVLGERCTSLSVEPTDESQLLQEPVLRQGTASQVPTMPHTSDCFYAERFSDQPYEDRDIASYFPANGPVCMTGFNVQELLQRSVEGSNSASHISEITNAELPGTPVLHTSATEVSAPENLGKGESFELPNVMKPEQNDANEVYQNLEELDPMDGVYFSDIVGSEYGWPPMPAVSSPQYVQQQDLQLGKEHASLIAAEELMIQELLADNYIFQEFQSRIIPSFQSVDACTSRSVPDTSQPKWPEGSNDQQQPFQEIDCFEADAPSATQAKEGEGSTSFKNQSAGFN